MLRYEGPNAEGVNEVIAVGFGAGVLKGGGELRVGAKVIGTVSEAVEAASGRGRFGKIGVERGEMQRLMNVEDLEREGYGLASTWGDLREHMVAECIWTSAYHKWRRGYEAEMEVVMSMGMRVRESDPEVPVMVAHLQGQLPAGRMGPFGRPGYWREFVAREAAGDLMYCAESRAFNGRTENFWEQMLEVYRAGWWPCGWWGRWPGEGEGEGGFLVWGAGK